MGAPVRLMRRNMICPPCVQTAPYSPPAQTILGLSQSKHAPDTEMSPPTFAPAVVR